MTKKRRITVDLRPEGGPRVSISPSGTITARYSSAVIILTAGDIEWLRREVARRATEIALAAQRCASAAKEAM